MVEKSFTTSSSYKTEAVGSAIGRKLRGGEVIELISDLGGGKTTLTRGITKGFGSEDSVTSPSFTISNVYGRPDGKHLYHFDFYRLNEAGIIANELAEIQQDTEVVVVVEWGEIVQPVLPKQRVTITIQAKDNIRTLHCSYPQHYKYLFE